MCLDIAVYLANASADEKITFWRIDTSDLITDSEEIIPYEQIQCNTCRIREAEFEVILNWNLIEEELKQIKTQFRMLARAKKEKKYGIRILPHSEILRNNHRERR